MKITVAALTCLIAISLPELALAGEPAHADTVQSHTAGSFGSSGRGGRFIDGRAGFASAMTFLRQRITRFPDDYWMNDIDLTSVKLMEFTYTRSFHNVYTQAQLLQEFPQRPLVDYATGNFARAGDEWSARACAAYAGHGATGAIHHTYNFDWEFQRTCAGETCLWLLTKLEMQLVPQCENQARATGS